MLGAQQVVSHAFWGCPCAHPQGMPVLEVRCSPSVPGVTEMAFLNKWLSFERSHRKVWESFSNSLLKRGRLLLGSLLLLLLGNFSRFGYGLGVGEQACLLELNFILFFLGPER